MQPVEALKEPQGRAAVEAVAKHCGVSPAQVEAALAALLPQVGRVVERNTLSRGGLADLVGALGDPRYRRALEDPAGIGRPETRSAGIELLETMLGNKDQSRAIAARAAASSGLTETLIKQLLPYLIPMIVGAIAKSGGGALGDIISRLPTGGGQSGGQRTARPPQPSPPMPRAGQGPLPLPGEHTPLGGGGNPYSDLSDTIRQGGGLTSGGGLPGIVRSILGGLLGFQNRGVISWIIRFIVMRWGWSILRAIFGRLLFGR